MPPRLIRAGMGSKGDLYKGTWGDLQVGDRVHSNMGAVVTHVGPSKRRPVSGVPLHHVRMEHPEHGVDDRHEFAHEPSAHPGQPEAGIVFYRAPARKAARTIAQPYTEER